MALVSTANMRDDKRLVYHSYRRFLLSVSYPVFSSRNFKFDFQNGISTPNASYNQHTNSHRRPPALTTDETYKSNVIAQGLPVDIQDFDGFKLCWLGARDAKQVIVYTCGGGLIMHAYDAHIINLINGYKVMKGNGQDVAIAILVYGLCPGAPYPTQLRQMVETVQHLLKTRGPETINFSGDSAGGMLINALLLHHSHPHPKVEPYTLPAGSRFGQALLVCPGAPVMTQTASMLQDPNPDIVTQEIVNQMWGAITSTSEEGVQMPNPWIGSSLAPEEWWKGLPIGEVKIIVGGLEALRDDIAIWSAFLKVSYPYSYILLSKP